MVGWGWCSQVRAFSELQFGPLREVWWHARGREHCRRGESVSALSDVYADHEQKRFSLSSVAPGQLISQN